MKNQNPIQVAVVEDNKDIAKLTQQLLALYPDIECVAVFYSAEEFKKYFPDCKADVVLMDIGLPQQNGIECLKEVRLKYPQTEFVMFTDFQDSEKVFQALSVGASGYVLKGGTPDNLASAIRDVHAGGSPMSRAIARLVANSFKKGDAPNSELEQLTRQETEILRGLDKGWSYKEIASQHFISEHTVRTHVRHIYEKLQVHTRTEALNKLHSRA